MIFAVPIAGKVLAGLAASDVGAAPATQTTDPRKTGDAADAVDFTQTVDNLNQAAGAFMTQHGAHGAAKG
ncbi:MAG: hypothetical protein ABSC22_16675 [Roseiarcus sp.]|jgi:hypothetical protein